MVDDGSVDAVDAVGRYNVERVGSDDGEVRVGDADEAEELEVGDGVGHTDVTVDKDDDEHGTGNRPTKHQKNCCVSSITVPAEA